MSSRRDPGWLDSSATLQNDEVVIQNDGAITTECYDIDSMSFLKNIFNKVKESFNNDQKPEEENLSQQQSSTAAQEKKETVKVDHLYIEKLEETLIKSDLGVELALALAQRIQNKFLNQEIKTEQIQNELTDFLLESIKNLESPEDQINKDSLNIFLIVGVNGVGKTTSIGKLANLFKKQNHKTLIAAGDTFRAAAEAQLNIWAERAGVDIVQLEDGAKASTVVYKAIEKAKAEDYQVLIIDTAGRLQNKENLMQELKKIKEVATKNLDNTPHEFSTFLVLDASTGSNALSQAEKFNEATNLDGIILTKFDGSAKAGMVFSLASKLQLAVKFVGTGENISDIEYFDSKKFITDLIQ